MTGPATAGKAFEMIFKWVVMPIAGLITAVFIFFFGYGVYKFFS